MKGIIDAALGRSRTVLLVLMLVLISGSITYVNIPKEANPDIDIPIIYVQMSHEGISPEDAERLLVRPMEQELKSIEGVKEISASAYEDGASVTLEFDAGFDADQAMLDVREKVDLAKSNLPEDTDDPTVHEVNVGLQPILVVSLSGDAPERTLISLGRKLRDKLEALPGVLEVEIGGDREEMVEIVVDPLLLESYQLSQVELFQYVNRNNKLVAAGVLDSGQGRFPVKVPGVFESVEDMLNLPIKTNGSKLVRVRDIGTVRRVYKDADNYARVGGLPAITLEIKKRLGANIIDTVNNVKALVQSEQEQWPQNIKVDFYQDESKGIRDMLNDLQNSVLFSVLLVVIVIIAALGLRTAGLVGIAVPGSFVTGVLVLGMTGLTVNIVVLFALIMAVGMLVDGAIVVTEFADRKMAEGVHKRDAYRQASKRMAWPIIASTATTLAAFMPLVFWPGVVGEFMKYLPITLIATLTASLAMALVFVPTLGSIFGAPGLLSDTAKRNLANAENGDLNQVTGITGSYIKLMQGLLHKPKSVLFAAVLVLVSLIAAYGVFGKGSEFFPEVEPEFAVVKVRARGDLSINERDVFMREVESRVISIPELSTVYAQTETDSADVIGTIQIEFKDWDKRERRADAVLQQIRDIGLQTPGVLVEAQKLGNGPGGDSKAINLQLSSRDPAIAFNAIPKILAWMDKVGGFTDTEDSRPLPGIEWQVKVDRGQAGRFGADIALVGSYVQLVTNGIKLGGYRPYDTDDEIDIRVRFPYQDRNLSQLGQLRVLGDGGYVPISNFVEVVPAQKVATIKRVDGQRVYSIEAAVIAREGEEVVSLGALANARLAEMKEQLLTIGLDPELKVAFKGQDQEQAEAEQFLVKAFAVALFVMGIILVTQFNSFYQAGLILTAVIFSIGGVLLGLIIMGLPFGIVMSGVGVISLAGIVVNNNIVLIDTYNILRSQGMNAHEAVLRTGAQRLRPVLLTTVTTILGLLPMVMQLNIDLFAREIKFGAPSSQWWVQLASAVAGGLLFATLLTLVLTPCLLVLKDGRKNKQASRPSRDLQPSLQVGR